MTLTYTWHPSRDYLDHSNVARLMRTLSVATADELRARSVADIGAFWDAVVQDLEERTADQRGMLVGLCEPTRAHPRTEPGHAGVDHRRGYDVADRFVLQVRT